MKLNARLRIQSRSRTKYPESPALTICRTVLKESDDLVILGVAIDSNMTFGNHIALGFQSSFSKAYLATWGSPGYQSIIYSMIDCFFLRRCFRGFVLPVLEYCFAGWCSALDLHLKQLDWVVSGASFLTGGVFECDLAHRRSVAILCMLYKVRCNLMHPLYGALPCSAVCFSAVYTQWMIWVHIGILMASSQQNLTVPHIFYSPLSTYVELSCCPCISWCGTGGFLEWIFIGLSCSLPSLFFLSVGWYCGAGDFWLIVCQSLSPGLALTTYFK